MGAWGVEAWQSDGAADWFTEVFKQISFDEQIRAAFKYFDSYDQIRAACHLLAGLGQAGVWPGELNTLQSFLNEGIELLTDMIDPQNADHDFMEQWDNDPEVIAAVRQQITLLQQRLKELGQDPIAGVRAQTFGNSNKSENDDPDN